MWPDLKGEMCCSVLILVSLKIHVHRNAPFDFFIHKLVFFGVVFRFFSFVPASENDRVKGHIVTISCWHRPPKGFFESSFFVNNLRNTV